MGGRLGALVLATLALAGCSGGGDSPVWATGSSTVYPFSKIVADAFVRADEGRTAPKIETTGTETGIARLCEGKDAESPDIANASRQMSRTEFDRCATKGVRDIIEVPIGLDGIVLVESVNGPKFALTRTDLYKALAANPLGKPNVAKTWKDVNPALPAIAIKVMGPPPSSGTRDVFIDLLLQGGCLEAMPEATALRSASDPAAFDRACRQLRSDGAYVEAGEDDAAIVDGLTRDPNAVGILGYSYLERNAARLRGIPIDGVTPDYATISGGKYPGARTLYLYTRKSRLEARESLRDFLALHATMGNQNGPLAKAGLVVMSAKARDRARDAVVNARLLESTALL